MVDQNHLEKRVKVYTIPLRPVAWARAQPAWKLERMFDKQKREKMIVAVYIQQQHNGEDMFNVPRIDWEFYFKEKPNDHKKPEYPWYSQTPDADNCIKFLLDTMKNIVFWDDRVVVSGSYKKQYAKEDKIVITVTELVPKKSMEAKK